MLGTFMNAGAIVLGSAIGLTVARDMSPRTQGLIKSLLGAFVVYAGFHLMWTSIHGRFGQVLGQFGIMLLAILLGNIIGKLLRLQRFLNRLGQYAKERLASANAPGANRFSEGFITATLLFCVGPMAILGALQDGLTGSVRTLAIKSAMDGLASMAFVRTFGWGVMLAAVPVLAYQGTITLSAHLMHPFLQQQELVNSINATGGLLICCISLIIFEVKKVPLADYLPALAVAPLLTWWWR